MASALRMRSRSRPRSIDGVAIDVRGCSHLPRGTKCDPSDIEQIAQCPPEVNQPERHCICSILLLRERLVRSSKSGSVQIPDDASEVEWAGWPDEDSWQLQLSPPSSHGSTIVSSSLKISVCRYERERVNPLLQDTTSQPSTIALTSPSATCCRMRFSHAIGLVCLPTTALAAPFNPTILPARSGPIPKPGHAFTVPYSCAVTCHCAYDQVANDPDCCLPWFTNRLACPDGHKF